MDRVNYMSHIHSLLPGNSYFYQAAQPGQGRLSIIWQYDSSIYRLCTYLCCDTPGTGRINQRPDARRRCESWPGKPRLDGLSILTLTTQIFLASEAVFVITVCGAKCVVVLFLRRLLSRDMRRANILCWIVLGTQLVWGLGALLAALVSCSAASLLTTSLADHCPSQVLSNDTRLVNKS